MSEKHTLYANGIGAYENAPVLTVGDLKRTIARCKIPDTAVLIASSDEEGNRYGRVFIISHESYDELNREGLELDGQIPDTTTDVVIFTPAI